MVFAAFLLHEWVGTVLCGSFWAARCTLVSSGFSVPSQLNWLLHPSRATFNQASFAQPPEGDDLGLCVLLKFHKCDLLSLPVLNY